MITLRNAEMADLELLQYWETKAHVIAADPDNDWDWASELAHRPTWRKQLIAELNGRPIGCIQIIDPAEEETHYWGDVEAGLRAIDIWIGEEADLGRGYGTEMMTVAIERCFMEPAVSAILIDPLITNTRAQRFYQRLGFEVIGPRRLGDSDCLVMRLERTVWENR